MNCEFELSPNGGYRCVHCRENVFEIAEKLCPMQSEEVLDKLERDIEKHEYKPCCGKSIEIMKRERLDFIKRQRELLRSQIERKKNHKN